MGNKQREELTVDYSFKLIGTTPLLMHADDVLAADDLLEWRKDPKNKGVSTPGDDRSPAWTWQTYLYTDGKNVAMPQDCIMAALRYAGAKVPGKGKQTFKSMSQSGLLIGQDCCEFLSNGKHIPMAKIRAFRDRPFSEHVKNARDLEFDLSVKRAAVGTSKHVRVRPRFDSWEVRGTIHVSEAAITESVLNQLFEISGRLAGLGDWRPSAPKKPGSYGMFTSEIKALS